MSLRLPTLLTAAVLVAAPVAVTALPASAATCTAPVVSTKVGPRTVVVDNTEAQDFDILVAVVANGCTIGDVTAVVTSPSKTDLEVPLELLGTDEEVTVYGRGVTLEAAGLANADAGTWRVRTTTQWLENQAADDSDEASDDGEDDGEDEDEPGDDSGDNGPIGTSPGDDDGDEGDADADEGIVQNAKVQVLAASELTADATSGQLRKGKIRKGRTLTVKGSLSRADWEAGRSVGYGKQKVELQFRTTKGGYKKVRTLKTRAGGAFAETVKTDRDGCYRVVFRGSKTTAATPSKAECIDVR